MIIISMCNLEMTRYTASFFYYYTKLKINLQQKNAEKRLNFNLFCIFILYLYQRR